MTYRDLETPTPGTKHFYVSAIDGARRYLLAGPYETHEAALAKVDAVNAYACDNDPRAHFMAWGTAGGDLFKTPLGANWNPEKEST